jgi:hypothetical protein
MLCLAAIPAIASAAIPAFALPALSRASVSTPTTGLASPYGEVSRFGGFDASGLQSGKFDVPVGFAVDPSDSSTADGNAVYVLDRVISEPEDEVAPLGYRLQKLSSTGSVLGSVRLPVEMWVQLGETHPLISLAVDSSKHRVYALVQSVVEDGGGSFVPVVQELVAWSTIPNSSKELLPAPGLPLDTITGAGLVAGESVLQPAQVTSDLYAPEALTIDPATHDVVIEAQKGVNANSVGGPTILQRLATETAGSRHAGTLDGSWTADSTIAPSEEQGGGLFTATDGSFGIDLYQSNGAISHLADVNPNFSTPTATPIAPDTSTGKNIDQAPSLDNLNTPNHNSKNGGPNGLTQDLEPYTAASPITQLTNGLYAARYGQEAAPGTDDPQSNVTPWNGVPLFWLRDPFASNDEANMGVRLFTADGTIITTIGGQAQGQNCNLDTEQLSVARGARGALFALTQSADNDQVIEYAPGGKGACPQPSGSLTVNGKSGSSFSFPVGTQVTLADSVNRLGETPYRFDWVLLNSSTLSLEDLSTQLSASNYTWPAPSIAHTFTKKGTYALAATVYGDYGLTYIASATIKID